MDRYVIGVDLGGTKITTALSDLEGKIINQVTIPTEAFEGEDRVLDRIIQTINSTLEKGKVNLNQINCIGIGSPGPLDSKEGIIISTANLPFKNFKLVGALKKEFNLPIYLDNDANVAAIGEFMFGAGKNTNNMVYVTISTGVGGGAIINGKIFRGSTSNALEIGHATIDKNGPRCNCGNIGCLEAFASGTAIAKRGQEAALTNAETTLKKYDKITSYEVFTEAKKGDRVATEIINIALEYLGVGIANVINTFDPDAVIIGGGVSKAGSIVFDKVKEVVNVRALKTMRDNCRILPAELGTDAGVVGAVALALMEDKE